MKTDSPPVPFIWRLMDATPGPLRGPVFFAWLVAVLPCLPVMMLLQRRRRKWWCATLSGQGRLITWQELQHRASSGTGTVLIEVCGKAAPRFWWVDESVTATSPIPPLAFSDLDLIAGGGYVPPSFVKWCYDRYVDPNGGRGLLAPPTDPPDRAALFRNFESFWRGYFPNTEVIFITFYDYRDT